ncbi:MAG: hypothetical protein IJC99_02525 [Clostridia bacterium]|nr:hypothetical protein [Clostridia bacterium]
MKKLIVMVLATILCLGMVSCSPANEQKKSNECYLGETVAFENGVEFTVTSAKFQTEIQGTYATHRADEGNKYVLLQIKVVNNSNEGYSAEGNEIWLNYNGARIAQINLIRNWEDGFDDISQSPTTTKTYDAFFQVGEQVQMSDLALVITNESLFNNDAVKIWLTEK